MAAHREHVYQRLVDELGSHLATSAVVTAMAIACLGLAAWDAVPNSVSWLSIAALAGVYVNLPKLAKVVK